MLRLVRGSMHQLMAVIILMTTTTTHASSIPLSHTQHDAPELGPTNTLSPKVAYTSFKAAAPVTLAPYDIHESRQSGSGLRLTENYLISNENDLNGVDRIKTSRHRQRERSIVNNFNTQYGAGVNKGMKEETFQEEDLANMETNVDSWTKFRSLTSREDNKDIILEQYLSYWLMKNNNKNSEENKNNKDTNYNHEIIDSMEIQNGQSRTSFNRNNIRSVEERHIGIVQSSPVESLRRSPKKRNAKREAQYRYGDMFGNDFDDAYTGAEDRIYYYYYDPVVDQDIKYQDGLKNIRQGNTDFARGNNIVSENYFDGRQKSERKFKQGKTLGRISDYSTKPKITKKDYNPLSGNQKEFNRLFEKQNQKVSNRLFEKHNQKTGNRKLSLSTSGKDNAKRFEEKANQFDRAPPMIAIKDRSFAAPTKPESFQSTTDENVAYIDVKNQVGDYHGVKPDITPYRSSMGDLTQNLTNLIHGVKRQSYHNEELNIPDPMAVEMKIASYLDKGGTNASKSGVVEINGVDGGYANDEEKRTVEIFPMHTTLNDDTQNEIKRNEMRAFDNQQGEGILQDFESEYTPGRTVWKTNQPDYFGHSTYTPSVEPMKNVELLDNNNSFTAGSGHSHNSNTSEYVIRSTQYPSTTPTNSNMIDPSYVDLLKNNSNNNDVMKNAHVISNQNSNNNFTSDTNMDLNNQPPPNNKINIGNFQQSIPNITEALVDTQKSYNESKEHVNAEAFPKDTKSGVDRTSTLAQQDLEILVVNDNTKAETVNSTQPQSNSEKYLLNTGANYESDPQPSQSQDFDGIIEDKALIFNPGSDQNIRHKLHAPVKFSNATTTTEHLMETGTEREVNTKIENSTLYVTSKEILDDKIMTTIKDASMEDRDLYYSEQAHSKSKTINTAAAKAQTHRNKTHIISLQENINKTLPVSGQFAEHNNSNNEKVDYINNHDFNPSIVESIQISGIPTVLSDKSTHTQSGIEYANNSQENITESRVESLNSDNNPTPIVDMTKPVTINITLDEFQNYFKTAEVEHPMTPQDNFMIEGGITTRDQARDRVVYDTIDSENFTTKMVNKNEIKSNVSLSNDLGTELNNSQHRNESNNNIRFVEVKSESNLMNTNEHRYNENKTALDIMDDTSPFSDSTKDDTLYGSINKTLNMQFPDSESNSGSQNSSDDLELLQFGLLKKQGREISQEDGQQLRDNGNSSLQDSSIKINYSQNVDVNNVQHGFSMTLGEKEHGTNYTGVNKEDSTHNTTSSSHHQDNTEVEAEHRITVPFRVRQKVASLSEQTRKTSTHKQRPPTRHLVHRLTLEDFPSLMLRRRGHARTNNKMTISSAANMDSTALASDGADDGEKMVISADIRGGDSNPMKSITDNGVSALEGGVDDGEKMAISADIRHGDSERMRSITGNGVSVLEDDHEDSIRHLGGFSDDVKVPRTSAYMVQDFSLRKPEDWQLKSKEDPKKQTNVQHGGDKTPTSNKSHNEDESNNNNNNNNSKNNSYNNNSNNTGNGNTTSSETAAQSLSLLIPQIPAPKARAAVSAVLTSHFGPTKQQIVPFDLELLDLADNYDNTTGMFIATIPGTYVISVYLMSHPGAKVNARVYVNDRPVAALWADDIKHAGFYPSSSIQTIAQLGFGDQVYVMLVDGGYGDSWVHANYNVFTVFLLYEETFS